MVSKNLFLNDPMEEGGHFEAVMRMQNILKKTMQDVRKSYQDRALNILDFGSGRYGLGRALIKSEMRSDDRLSLYDPCTQIQTTLREQIRIITTEDIFGPDKKIFDIVNISYVLCCMEHEQSQELLERIRDAQPEAVITIFDYILEGRQKHDVLRLLSAGEERHWMEKVGEDEFYKSRTRFSESSILQLTKDSGLETLQFEYLDSKYLRAGIVAKNQNQNSHAEKVHSDSCVSA